MKQRGRPSFAALALRAGPQPVELVRRQVAPSDLTDEEVEVWLSIVEDMPADWFSPPTVPLLAQYCRHTVASRRIGEMIKRQSQAPDFTADKYDRLLGMQARESTTLKALAASMRIAQQSTVSKRANTLTKAARKPWES
jgi:hypothetical protein